MALGVRAFLPAAISLLARQVAGGSMAAWWTDLGPSLLIQDDDTARLRYSLCNSKDTPILPGDRTITAPLASHPPKNGTALAGTGWWDNTVTWASIFYQDEDDSIINTLLKCDMSTGYWSNNGDYVISNDSPSVANDTGLAAVLLGSTTGYRVFYHDVNRTLRQIGYTQDTSWRDEGYISRDQGLGVAIAATFSSKENMTVAVARDDANVEVSRYNSDSSWHVTTFPQPLAVPANTTAVTNATNATDIAYNTSAAATALVNFSMPAWDAAPAALGLAVDKASTRSLFYIGTDAQLHQVGNINYAWQVFDSQNATAWPPADAAKAPLAVASDPQTSVLRVYYTSGGQVVEANGDNSRWAAAAALPSANSSSASTTASSTASTSSSSAGANGDGLSAGAKAGVGVGVGVGIVALGAIVGAIVILRRRHRRQEAAQAAGGSTVGGSTAGGSEGPNPPIVYSQAGAWSEYSSPNSAYGGHPQQGYGTGYNAQQAPAWGFEYKPTEKPPGELDSTAAVHEMPENRVHHEMMGEGHYREAP